MIQPGINTRKHSVPYAVGYLVEDLARELENEFKL